jgi:uncharacterized membrane protein
LACEEKSRLLDLYKAAVAAHSAAVKDMTLTRGKTSKLEYERIWNRAEQARADSDTASAALYQHTKEHGC